MVHFFSHRKYFRSALALLFASSVFSHSLPAEAGLLTFRFGPPSLGTGGSNPLGIPPGPQDIEVAWLSNSNWETSFSIVPGILIGKRQDIGNFYVSGGGGIIINANGSGLGPYTAFGWESAGTYRFSFEYKQALGFTSAGMISPYALRAGIGIAF